jgi:hypothetical protein
MFVLVPSNVVAQVNKCCITVVEPSERLRPFFESLFGPWIHYAWLSSVDQQR